jgi:hypothetical protein
MTTQTLRAPTFSWKSVIKPIGKVFADIYNAFVEARMAKARYELAQHLIETNADFKGMAISEVYTKLQSQNTARY